MHTYDEQKAARVWQRVRGSEASGTEDRSEDRSAVLPELIMNEWNAAAVYLHLARQMQPKQAQILQQLSREELAHAACLKGIYTLMTGQKAVTRSPQPEKEPPELTLRKCYGREMRSLKQYEAWSDDPEYGHVFAKLAQQEREHCRTVLELLGSLEKDVPGKNNR